MLKVIRRGIPHWSPFHEIIVVKALTCECLVSNFVFFAIKWELEEGESVRLVVRRNEQKEEGETLDFEYCLKKDKIPILGKREIPGTWFSMWRRPERSAL